MEKEDFIFKTINNLQDEIVKLKEEIKNISKDKNEESSNKEIAYNIDKITATLNVHTAHISALEKRTSRWTDKLKFGRFKPKSVEDDIEQCKAKAKRVNFNLNED